MNGFWFRALLVGLFSMGTISVANAQQPPAEKEQAEAKKSDEKKADEKKADEKKADEKKADEKKAEPANKADEKKAEPAEKAEPEEKAEAPKPASEKKAEEAPKAAEAEPEEAPEAEPEKAEAEPKKAPEPKAAEAKPAPAPEEKAAEAESEPAPKQKAAEAAPKNAAPKNAAPKNTTAAAPTGAGAATSSDDDEGTRLGVDGFPITESTKAWSVLANLGGSLGTGFMAANQQVNTPSFGWSLDVIGSYTLTPLFEGRLDSFLRVGMDQVLANTVTEVAVGQTKQREFFFRDIRLGVRGANLYTEKLTGISVTGSLEGFLPTSKTTIGTERWFRLGASAVLGRTFEGLGPGNLTLQWSTVFRKDFAPRVSGFTEDENPTNFAACRKTSRELDNLDRCVTAGGRNSNYSFINNLGVSYIWGPVTVSASLAIYSVRYWAQGPAELEPGVRRSSNATGNTWLNLTYGTIEVAYLFLDNWSASVGLSTYQSPYTFSGESNSTLRFPFFDTVSTPQNNTTIDFGIGFFY